MLLAVRTERSDFGPRDWAGASWRGRSCGASRWTAFEIVAMVLGFIVFWPIGLAILGFKLGSASRRSGRSADGRARQMARGAQRMMVRSGQPGMRLVRARRLLCRLDRQRGFRRVEGGGDRPARGRAPQAAGSAARVFRILDTIRRAKDREEFERFMNERRNRPAGGGAEARH